MIELLELKFSHRWQTNKIQSDWSNSPRHSSSRQFCSPSHNGGKDFLEEDPGRRISSVTQKFLYRFLKYNITTHISEIMYFIIVDQSIGKVWLKIL